MKVHFIDTDDWTTMYIDGALVEEGHSIRARTVAELILGKENVTSTYIEYDWDEDGPEYDRARDSYVKSYS